MLATRVVTALVLLAVLALGLTIAAPWGFPLLAVLFVAVASFEWMKLLSVARPMALAIALLAAGAVAVLGVLAASVAIDGVLLASTVVWLALAAQLSVKRRFWPVSKWRGACLVLGWLLPVACGLALLLAYRRGLIYLVSVLALVWVADIAAYFTGRAFGRHKLAPLISPGKTIEGALGGCLAVMAIATLSTQSTAFSASYFSDMWQHMPVLGFLFLLMVLVALSIVGDLFESHLKRQAGVKDSGTILPGHGGVLDRIDALLPVIPIAVLLGRYL